MQDTGSAAHDHGRVVRQGTSIASGGVLIGLCTLWLVVYLLTDRGGGIEPVLWPAAIILLAWAVLLRPSVRIGTDGVLLRNVLRDVHLPWPTIDLVESRWALTLVTPEGEAHQSWAIAAQSPKRSAVPRATAAPGVQRAASAGRVGAAIRDGAEGWAERVGKGEWPTPESALTVRPAISGIAAVGLAVVAMVWALLI